MTYCSTSDVYRAAGITSTEVSTADVTQAILESEREVDRFTNTTYWNVEDSGTATAGTTTTLTDSGKSWGTTQYVGDTIWIYSGTGSGQARRIISHTATAITVDTAFTTTPTTASLYRIIHSGSLAYISKTIDGNGAQEMFLDKYPLRILQTLAINGTTVTTTNVYQYEETGRLLLKNSAEKTLFDNSYPQLVAISYWYGVFEGTSSIAAAILPREIKRYTEICAAMRILTQQIGGTFDDPSTFQLPEASGTVGQAYINIEATVRWLQTEKRDLERVMVRYHSFA